MRISFLSLLVLFLMVAVVLSPAPAQAAEYKWTGDGFVMVNAAAPTAADETAITEHELLASTPRRTVTRTTTSSASWAAAPAVQAAPMAASSCSSSSSRTVTRSRSFAPVRRLFGVRLRGGC